MIVRMKYQISGTRGDQMWPKPGETIELPDGEAEILLRTQMAEVVNDAQEPTKAEEPKTEAPKGDTPVEATPKKAPAKRGRPRKTTATKAVER